MAEWRYFWVGEDTYTQMVFRWPANGKRFRAQDDKDIQMFGLNGEWLVVGKLEISSVAMNGWFSEDGDEISEDEANEFIRKGFGRYRHAWKPD